MHFSSYIVAAITLFSSEQFTAIHGFSVSPLSSRQTSSSALFSEAPVQAEVTSSEPRRKPLSPKELLAQVRKSRGLPEEEEEDDDEAPKLFAESLYDDMRNILLMLEKRVADGPGALSLLEVEDFSAASNRILVEMKEKEADRLAGRLDMRNANPVVASAPAQPVAAVAAATPAPVQPAAPAVTSTPAQTVAAIPQPAPTPQVEVMKSKSDISEDEGPSYDGTGGFGMAKGTVNTYVIPGMDEMSPEEYQKALQQSIIDRQENRKRSGNYGNRATWDYLNNLTGESGQLKKNS